MNRSIITLTCVDCTFDETGCTGDGPTCGDDVAEGDEECDGTDLGGLTCEDFGFNGGTLSCTDCQYNVFDCTFIVEPECGNNEADALGLNTTAMTRTTGSTCPALAGLSKVSASL